MNDITPESSDAMKQLNNHTEIATEGDAIAESSEVLIETDDNQTRANVATSSLASKKVDPDALAVDDEHQLQDMKLTMLDSAELATKAASLASKAGAEMHKAALKLISAFSAQEKQSKIILAGLGSVMLIAVTIFGIMSYRLQDRVGQLDAIVLAVGKRIVSMNNSLETISASADTLKDIALKQDALTLSQVKLDSRLDEVIVVTKGMPEVTTKLIDSKNQEILKLLQSLDARVQAQAAFNKLLSAQLQKIQSSQSESAGLVKELEAISRQQKQIRTQELATSTVKPIVNTPIKPKERLVQYPRTVQPGTPTDTP